MLFPSVGSPSSIKEVPALTIVGGRLHAIEELTIALLPLGISKPIFPGMFTGFPGGTSGKEPGCHAGDIRDVGSIPGLGRFPREGNGNPLRYSFLENRMHRGAWQATVHGVIKESDMT